MTNTAETQTSTAQTIAEGTASNYSVAPRPASRAVRRAVKAKARRRTPSVDELYGALVRAGQVRIIRKKGQPPKIVWL